jgi:integrase
VSFERKTVTFRPNAWRALKTLKRPRVVPLFPGVEVIVRPYVFGDPRPDGDLLFRNTRGGMITSVTGAFDEASALLRRLGVKFAHVRRHAGPDQYDLRRSFCAAALQILDGGRPIAPDTVARWLGRGGHSLARRVYGHLGEVRHRGEHVSFDLSLARERFPCAVRTLRARAAEARDVAAAR